jgi:hypothetical protein
MTICHVLSYKRNWLCVYVRSEPQFVEKQVTNEYALLLSSAVFYLICGCLVPGK